ncbi:hypothetical protein K490DRAFT_60126 [Saccharata proteae CBS 121410]|uniref:Uncharacterized protein n=1 Tax=Saccharata proteae CBS 121410 TaxID=1314787 RepID=A0A9P4LU76_9PEZI|nr:hypothetical protein K490DRAFT_60126 [Saccharata proteae CBS 121410]
MYSRIVRVTTLKAEYETTLALSSNTDKVYNRNTDMSRVFYARSFLMSLTYALHAALINGLYASYIRSRILRVTTLKAEYETTRALSIERAGYSAYLIYSA